MGGVHLGEPGTEQTLRRHLEMMQAVDVVQSAAKINALLERVSGNDTYGSDQRDLVGALFPSEIATRLQAALDAGSDGGGFDVLFFPGQLLALQKLALAVAQPGPPTSFGGGTLVGHFVTAAAQVNDLRDALVPIGAEDMSEIDLAAYAFRAGELNRIRFPPTVVGRAHQLWIDSPLPWPTGVEAPDEFCERTLGMSLKRFVAIASAPAFGRLDVDLDKPGDVPFNPGQYFGQTKVTSYEATRVFSRLTYGARRGTAAITDPASYWSFFDMADRPLVPCGSEIVVPCSVRYALERATTGLFWMLHAASGGNVGALTTHFGHMFEAYCVQAAMRLASPILTVSGDMEYPTADGTVRTSDILITTLSTTSTARIFIECRAGRPRGELFTTGSIDAFEAYLGDLAGKLDQLDRCIRDHMQGRFVIPDDLAGANDAYVPVLVADEPFQWTFPLKIVLDEMVRRRRLFRHPRVTMPVICSVHDFDTLVGSCERGDDLAVVLRAYLASDRMDPLDVTIFERSGPLKPSTYCWDGWTHFTSLVMGELFE